MSNKIVIIRNAAKTDFGGGEKVPVFIAREISKHSNLQPIVLSGSQKLLDFAASQSVAHMKTWWWSKQNWSGIHILLTPIYLLWQIILTIYYVIIFTKLQPSVVHLQSKDDFIAGTLAAHLLGIRVLWSDYADLKHVFVNFRIWYKNPIGKMVYHAAKLAEIVIVVSEQDKKLVSAHIPEGKVKDKLQVMYYGAFDTYEHVPEDKPFTFISSSRIVTDKGIRELIEAFDKFYAIHPDSKLNIMGDGPEKKHFIEMAKHNPAITFLGHQSDPLDFVAKATVFIIPTYHEGFSIALVEACMLGMPIIATNIGGNPEIIQHRKNGLLINVKDSDDLFKAMDELYVHTNLRLTIGRNARNKYLKQFNFQAIIEDKLIPLYQGINK